MKINNMKHRRLFALGMLCATAMPLLKILIHVPDFICGFVEGFGISIMLGILIKNKLKRAC